jgi:lipid-A-disaccharide synthase
MKYYLIAGERSGDLHGGNLIKAIAQHDPAAEFRAWGGEAMQKAGAQLVTHYSQMAFMGVWEVIKNLLTIQGFLKQCKADLLAYQPDVVILIDYAGFNMKIARFAKQNGLKTFYYISPKVWAWNQDRAWNIKKYVDKLFVIFPFEQAFFERYDYKVDYVGNPLFDAIADFAPNPNFLAENNLDPQRPIVALLPGSRKQEVEQMLGVMAQSVAELSDYQIVIAAVSNLPHEVYAPFLNQNTKLVTNAAYDLLTVSRAALVTSGTATLETALLNVPQVVCYKANWLSYQIGIRLIKVPFVSLVNLVAEKEVVKELIQAELTPQKLLAELQPLLTDGPERVHQLSGYQEVKDKLGTKGASEKAGRLMVQYLLQ